MVSSKSNSTIIKKQENSTNKPTSKKKSLSDLSIFTLIFNCLMPKWKNISLKESLNRIKDKSSTLPEDLVSAKFTQIMQVSEEES